MKASELKELLEKKIASDGDLEVYLYVSGAYRHTLNCYVGPFNDLRKAIWISDDERGADAP